MLREREEEREEREYEFRGKDATCSHSTPLAKRYGEQRTPVWPVYVVPRVQRKKTLSLLQLQGPNGMLTQGHTKKIKATIQ